MTRTKEEKIQRLKVNFAEMSEHMDYKSGCTLELDCNDKCDLTVKCPPDSDINAWRFSSHFKDMSFETADKVYFGLLLARAIERS